MRVCPSVRGTMKRPAAAIERPEAAAIEQPEAAAIQRPQARCARSAEAIAVHDDEYTLEDAVSGRLPKNAAEYTQHVEPLIQRTVDKCWSELTDKDKQALVQKMLPPPRDVYNAFHKALASGGNDIPRS